MRGGGGDNTSKTTSTYKKRRNLLVEKAGEARYRIRGGKMPLFEIAAALLKRGSDMQSTRHDTSADRGQHFENGFGNFEKCYFFYLSGKA